MSQRDSFWGCRLLLSAPLWGSISLYSRHQRESRIFASQSRCGISQSHAQPNDSIIAIFLQKCATFRHTTKKFLKLKSKKVLRSKTFTQNFLDLTTIKTHEFFDFERCTHREFVHFDKACFCTPKMILVTQILALTFYARSLQHRKFLSSKRKRTSFRSPLMLSYFSKSDTEVPASQNRQLQYLGVVLSFAVSHECLALKDFLRSGSSRLMDIPGSPNRTTTTRPSPFFT